MWRDAASELALTELKALEVAKALATEPQLLLLDEVLAGLETSAKRRFMGMLRDLHARFGVGIVMIQGQRFESQGYTARQLSLVACT